MKQLLVVIVMFSIFLFSCFSCEKDSKTKPEPPPSPEPKTASVTVKFGPLPENCAFLSAREMRFGEGVSNLFTKELREDFKYPEYTYDFTPAEAEKYLGKKVIFFLSACRNPNPGNCWGVDIIKEIESLQPTQEIYVPIPAD